MNQLELLKKYTDENIKPFNPELFKRSDDMLIEELKKVILSCQHSYGYTLKVLSFTVIDDYEAVQDTLYSYYEMKPYVSGKKKDRKLKTRSNANNPYNHIKIKETDMNLLIVKYYLEVGDKAETFDVIIAVPRIVKKYYFKINGNYFLSQYQIVDTTYNNSTSSAIRLPKVTIRTSRPIRIFMSTKMLMDINKREIPCARFISKVQTKMFGCCKYLLGRYGLYQALVIMGYDRFLMVSDHVIDNNNYYVFEKYGIYIHALKSIYDVEPVFQSLVYELHFNIIKDSNYQDIFSRDYWLLSLGREFNVDTIEKGINTLISIEEIYDLKTREILRIPENDKQDIYHLLLWCMREFEPLLQKSNLDLGCKRLNRPEEYVPSLYASKLTTGFHRISNAKKKKLTINSIKKVVCTLPMYLISAVSKCNLINYRDLVHDLDSFVVLSSTFKEITGLGTETMQSVQACMREIDVSHIGRIDLDSSKKSDPGLTNNLVPTCKIYDNGYFSEYREPDTWRDNFAKVMDAYKKTTGLKEALIFESRLLDKDYVEDINNLEETLQTMKSLIRPIYFVDEASSILDIYYAMEYSGVVTLSDSTIKETINVLDEDDEDDDDDETEDSEEI